jgi:hypothetical protein
MGHTPQLVSAPLAGDGVVLVVVSELCIAMAIHIYTHMYTYRRRYVVAMSPAPRCRSSHAASGHGFP